MKEKEIFKICLRSDPACMVGHVMYCSFSSGFFQDGTSNLESACHTVKTMIVEWLVPWARGSRRDREVIRARGSGSSCWKSLVCVPW